MKKLIATALLTLLLAAPAAFAGEIHLPGTQETPGITGSTETPAVNGVSETPGINADQPPGGSGGEIQSNGEIQYPGIMYILAVLFGIS